MASDVVQRLRAMPASKRAAFVESLSPEELLVLDDLIPAPESELRDWSSPIELARRLDPAYTVRAHLRLISDRVVSTIATSGRLIVNIPPQYGKSELLSHWTPAWYLDRWPQKHVVVATHTQPWATHWGRRTRRTVQAHRDLMTVRISADSSAAKEWETTAGGGMVARGIGAELTGRPADLLVIDDPIKDREQANSAAFRQANWDWWTDTAVPRLQPGAAVVLLMTRWHEDDLAGRMLSDEWQGDPADWDVIRLPALAETPDDEAAEWWLRMDDPLGRDEGAPLIRPQAEQTPTEARANLAAIRKSVGPYTWNGLYQQRPSEPEGSILKKAWWQYWTRDPDDQIRLLPDRFDEVIQSWDMAFKDTKTASYVVGQVWGKLGPDRYLLDQVRDRLDFTATIGAFRKLTDAWPAARRKLVEDKANGPAVINTLQREIAGIVPYTPEGSKESRAHAATPEIESGNVYLPSSRYADWVVEFVQECSDFPTGAHDDQVDAATQALDYFQDRSSPGRGSSPAGHRLPGPSKGGSGLRILGGRRG